MHDPFFKKVIPFEFKGNKLLFNVAQSLFSSQSIDKGTQRLLRTFLNEDISKYKKILDVGCGYGPIGISLKSVAPESDVHMVDRDALALIYSRQNVDANNVAANIYPSLGYNNVEAKDFDLIISNIPAKVGGKVLRHLLLDAKFHLAPNGKVAVVVVDAITPEVKGILASDESVIISLEKSWPGHTVFHYSFASNALDAKSEEGSFEKGLYDRTTNTFSFNKRVFTLHTTYNLPEFDTLSYETELLFDELSVLRNKNTKTVAVFNPNQGHVSVALTVVMPPQKLILVDRNLQALETARRNLILNGFTVNKIELLHQPDINLQEEHGLDVIVGIIPEKEGRQVYEMFIDQLKGAITTNGIVLLASSSTVISIIEKIVKSKKILRIIKRSRSRGKSVLVMKRLP